MTLRIHTNKETIDVTTNANISVKELLEQLEAGNLVLIETIQNTTFIINMLNVNAVEIIDFNLKNINIPPIS